MSGKSVFLALVAACLLFSGCAASSSVEKPAADDAVKDSGPAVSAAPEVKDPKEEAKKAFAQGLMAMNHQNWKKSEGYFLEAIKLDPDNYNTHMYLARVYENMRQKTSAIEQYKIAQRLKPDESSPYGGLIGMYLDMGLADSAISTAGEASKRGIPEDTYAGDLGWAYYLKGDWEKSEKYFKNEKEIRKLDSTPRNNLGLVYYRQGRYEDALASFKEAAELNSNSKVLPYLLALTYNRLGKEDEVLKALEDGLKKDPNLEMNIISYNMNLFPKIDPGDLTPAFNKLREKKN